MTYFLLRVEQGWKYGVRRNNVLKETPCMVPYSDLNMQEVNYTITMVQAHIFVLQCIVCWQKLKLGVLKKFWRRLQRFKTCIKKEKIWIFNVIKY